MTCALLSIGTELTRGELVNENGRWLAERLSEAGHDVGEVVTVPDDDERIVASLQRLATSHEAVICTGGLGPTTDDRTTACVARLVDRPLVQDEASLQSIHEKLRARGRTPSPSNEKQASFPQGATVLDNQLGTANGFSIAYHESLITCLPGVPTEMHALFEQSVLPQMRRVEKPPLVWRARLFGIGESNLGDRLRDVEERYDVRLGYRASQGEIELKAVLSQIEGDDGPKRMAELQEDLRGRVGEFIYAEGRTSLAGAVGALLAERKLCLGLAESCTGGLVSEMMTSVPGSSAYFKGGVCCYANSVKEGLLGVLPATLELHGAVSFEVAREMAIGAQRVLGADITLAITGIAGPTGGSEQKPVGLVHWAVAHHGELLCDHAVIPGSREQVQRRAARAGLWAVRKVLLDTSR